MQPFDKKEREVLRRLADKVRTIAELPCQQQNRTLWQRLNDLEPCRPMVWINEIPWHEMKVSNELDLKCRHPLCRRAEEQLRQTIYCWNYMPVDRVVEKSFYAPMAIKDSGFGITEAIDFRQEDTESTILSREFKPQINDEKDLKKIQIPRISHDEHESEQRYHFYTDLFGDLLTIKKQGITHKWFAPWDYLVRYWGVEKAMTDLVRRPKLVHRAMERYIHAHLERLKQWQALNLLTSAEGNYRVGSGAYAYSQHLPAKPFDPQRVRPQDQWGCATAQIFCDVSPKMHEEFALQYEIRWLKNFGLNYYGCCEPLHNKIDLLRQIPNLRKISISPWADAQKSANQIERDYVLSIKPNPAVLAATTWNLESAKQELDALLQKTEGCNVEIVMKDISTVRYQPQRLWQWGRMAREVAEQFATG